MQSSPASSALPETFHTLVWAESPHLTERCPYVYVTETRQGYLHGTSRTGSKFRLSHRLAPDSVHSALAGVCI